MSIQEVIQALIGREKSKPDSTADFAAYSQCPQESVVLAYLEDALTAGQRKELEEHFIDCSDCRELLALTAEILDEQTKTPEVMAPMTCEAVREQTARVLAIIDKEEAGEGQPTRQEAESKAKQSRGFYLSYPTLAISLIVVCSIAVVPAYWLLKGSSPDESVMQQLVKTGRDRKRIEPQVSGLPWAEYDITRGDEDDKGINGAFNRAVSTLAYAENKSAPAESRIVLARVYLMRALTDDASHALKILQELSEDGVRSREVLNDTGVALLLTDRYGEALEKFNQALETSPDFSEALFNRALANEKAGKIDAAKRDLEQLINTTRDQRAKQEAERKLKLLGNS